MQLVLTQQQINQKIMRLSHEILENTYGEKQLFVGGIVGNGAFFAEQIATILKQHSNIEITVFSLDLDKDFPLNSPIQCSIPVEQFGQATIILVDDVINSGTTMQYALMKLLEQPVRSVKTVALVDRLHRRYPIKCDFVGMTLTTTLKERVEVIEEGAERAAYLI